MRLSVKGLDLARIRVKETGRHVRVMKISSPAASPVLSDG
jgi:hypothetical protein